MTVNLKFNLFFLDMPQSYIYRMVAMDFHRVLSEAPIDVDSDIKAGLTPEECQRMSRVKSSLHKYSRFKDRLPPDEMDEKIQEEERRTQVRTFVISYIPPPQPSSSPPPPLPNLMHPRHITVHPGGEGLVVCYH